jgi:hypothetical protein
MKHYIITDADKRVVLEFFSAPNDFAAERKVEQGYEEGDGHIVLSRLEHVCEWGD